LNVEPDRLRRIIDRFRDCRVAVLGDFFLDKYLDVDPSLAEISVETGKRANQVVAMRCNPGAAGTVVNNLAALGVRNLHLLGFTGDDGEGFELRRALLKLECDLEGLIPLPDAFTPTYLKPRDCTTAALSGEHERYDTKNRRPVPAAVQERVLARLETLLPQLHAVIILDQVEQAECGIVTSGVRESLARLAKLHPEILFCADSRNRIGLFRNVTLKVNVQEAVRVAFPDRGNAFDETAACDAMAELRRRSGRPLLVTAGRRGIWVCEGEPVLVRGVAVPEPTDPTGAGDSATASAVLALCAGATLKEAALVANLVASITVQQLATTGTARPEELGPRLDLWRSQA
jgi:bifunctional ADP-heptose synthase (sugar kinase/adenylyltransferase)